MWAGRGQEILEACPNRRKSLLQKAPGRIPTYNLRIRTAVIGSWGQAARSSQLTQNDHNRWEMKQSEPYRLRSPTQHIYVAWFDIS